MRAEKLGSYSFVCFFIDAVLVFGFEESTRTVFNSVASLRNKLQQGFEVFDLLSLVTVNLDMSDFIRRDRQSSIIIRLTTND